MAVLQGYKEKAPVEAGTNPPAGRETDREERRKTALRRTWTILKQCLWNRERGAFAVGALAAVLLAYAFAAGVGITLFLVLRNYIPQAVVLGFTGVVFVIVAVRLVPIGGALSSLGRLRQLVVKHLPSQGYGVCIGLTPPGSANLALTDWMHTEIQKLAGLPESGAPLTFGELDPDGKSGIHLRMVTSDLSHAQPFVLPFEENNFLFQEEEVRKFLPATVVEHLIRRAYDSQSVDIQLDGYYYLPPAKDLPILLAARMSLSFPILLSAFPLYTIRRSAYETRTQGERFLLQRESDLQKICFSDGGLASNFPIHFFDRWLPPLPTFGINLTEMTQEAFGAGPKEAVSNQKLSNRFQTANIVDRPGHTVSDEWEECERGVYDAYAADAVYLPKANAMMFPEWEPIESFGDFASAIWKTTSSFRDSAQTMLPSYRERVVQIRFADNEGGLNLAMKDKAIADIREKGRWAGEKLRREFDFEHHRWVRLRVLLAQLEAQMATARDEGNAISDYIALTKTQMAAGKDPATSYPYPQGEEWCAEAERRLNLLSEFIDKWTKMEPDWLKAHPEWDSFFPRDSPRPEPLLRMTPRL